MSRRQIIVSIILAAGVVAALVYFFIIPRDLKIEPVTAAEFDEAYEYLRGSLTDGRYTYADFLRDNGDVPVVWDERAGYNKARQEDYAHTSNGQPALFNFDALEDGFYNISAGYWVVGNAFEGTPVEVRINGEAQYHEALTVALPSPWKDVTKDFPLDKYGDEAAPEQVLAADYWRVWLFDTKYASDEPLKFYLRKGANTIEIVNHTSRDLLIEDMYVAAAVPLRSYAEYSAGKGWADESIEINATSYGVKSSPYARLGASDSPSAQPFDAVNKKINMVSLSKVGTEVSYDVEVAETGLYGFTVHGITSDSDFAAFCTVKVDGVVPFAEAASFAMSSSGINRWDNFVLGDSDGNAYGIWLEAGWHTISIKEETAPLYQAVRTLTLLSDHINQFALEIKKVTGKEIDKNRTWRLTRYIPETADYLDAYDVVIRGLIQDLAVYSAKGDKSATLSKLREAIALLDKLREKPDELPLYADNLANFGGDGTSVVKLCSEAADTLSGRGFAVDAIYLLAEGDTAPRANAAFTKSFGAGVEKVVASYVSPKYVVRNQADALNVWVNQPVVVVDAIQKLIDSRYTPATGVRVHLSVMPDMNKLVLAKAAGTNPDMAMGLASYVPFDLASRGALYDMTNFGDFWEYADSLVAGGFVSYVFNEGVYAVPETMNFAATVYREDIFKQLSLTVPDTWQDVKEITPTLQRFNMSFYMPIASGDGYKWFYQTSPLIYQNGGLLYQENGLGAAIGEPNAVKGLTQLGDLFTTYALAEQVPSFFNSFRYGQTPVGIVDNAGYMLIKNAAPELTGQWKLAAYPGTADENGDISRWYIGNGTGAVIFKDTAFDKETCWGFLKWWLGEDTQTDLSFSLAANYMILWLSANEAALANTPMDDEDLAVVIEMSKWMRDVPRSPGQYMLERSLSDIWNTMVFDDTPARVAIDEKLITIQREFRRKMQEFGYIDDMGEPTRPYAVREIEWVLEQMGKGVTRRAGN